jgi:hypothetical protein
MPTKRTTLNNNPFKTLIKTHQTWAKTPKQTFDRYELLQKTAFDHRPRAIFLILAQ